MPTKKQWTEAFRNANALDLTETECLSLIAAGKKEMSKCRQLEYPYPIGLESAVRKLQGFVR